MKENGRLIKIFYIMQLARPYTSLFHLQRCVSSAHFCLPEELSGQNVSQAFVSVGRICGCCVVEVAGSYIFEDAFA
jgi:hypothetical protein